MTVGVCINCTDGIVLACDSLTTFGRGVPVLKYSNKVQVLEHPGLLHPVALEAAGTTTYFDKFCDKAMRVGIDGAAQNQGAPLDIVEFCESVCEPVVLGMLKRYVYDRANFLTAIPAAGDFQMSFIAAGATRDGELRAYTVYYDGLSEQIDSYGTIGSGAAYAELFLRYLLRENEEITTKDAERLAVYAVKGVELMDPNVGGQVNIETLRMEDDKEEISCAIVASTGGADEKAKHQMEQVLLNLSSGIEDLVDDPGSLEIEEKSITTEGDGEGANGEP